MSRLEQYLDALVGSEDYVCPNCQGVGKLFTGYLCPTCDGAGRVTGAEMDAYDEQVIKHNGLCVLHAPSRLDAKMLTSRGGRHPARPHVLGGDVWNRGDVSIAASSTAETD